MTHLYLFLTYHTDLDIDSAILVTAIARYHRRKWKMSDGIVTVVAHEAKQQHEIHSHIHTDLHGYLNRTVIIQFLYLKFGVAIFRYLQYSERVHWNEGLVKVITLKQNLLDHCLQARISVHIHIFVVFRI